MSSPSSWIGPGGRLDQLDDHARRASTCRSPIRRRCQASRRQCTANDTPSTASTEPCRRPKRPRRSGKCLTSRAPRAVASAVRHAPPPARALGVPAGGKMRRRLLQQRRRGRAAAHRLASRQRGAKAQPRTARSAPAACPEFPSGRGRLRGRPEPSSDLRHRAEEAARCRDGAAGRTGPRPAPPRPCGRHT